MRRLLLLLPLLATTALGDATPHSVASLVGEKDPQVVAASVEPALASPLPLVRATAARVIAVRGLEALLPRVREIVITESDATAAREQIRALALLGSEDDVRIAVETASKWPPAMDDALAAAIARRGGDRAVQIYASTLHKTRMRNVAEFFRIALWGRPDATAITGSRVLANRDEEAWRGILGALRDSNVAMNGGVMAASLLSPSEEIRATSVWYLVRGYAHDPSRMAEILKQNIAEPRTELSSDREDFGRELLRRMIGGEKKDDPRWKRFLDTKEADRLLIGETAAHQYLTDDEYALRYARCEVQERECVIPKKRDRMTIPSQDVAPPAFNLPDVLPAGLADEVLAGAKCNDDWIGVGTATVDGAGRVKDLDLRSIETTPRCRKAIDTILRLSLATNTSLRSEFTGPVLLVHAAKSTMCLDEEPPQSAPMSTFRVGGEIEAPKAIKRVEPRFPESARRAMGAGRNVLVMAESVISKDGCVRNMRILRQSPYPELNGAAVMALSQWKFLAGQLDGKPVDVLFNVTINFKLN